VIVNKPIDTQIQIDCHKTTIHVSLSTFRKEGTNESREVLNVNQFQEFDSKSRILHAWQKSYAAPHGEVYNTIILSATI
jgi:hypothetical protein